MLVCSVVGLGDPVADLEHLGSASSVQSGTCDDVATFSGKGAEDDIPTSFPFLGPALDQLHALIE